MKGVSFGSCANWYVPRNLTETEGGCETRSAYVGFGALRADQVVETTRGLSVGD